MKKFFGFLFLLFISITSFSQLGQQPSAAEIKLRLKKLNFLGSVLYMAAHPDDENTRIITYLSKGRLATTGYLSLTRGDGGQNLIGPELRDELGVIRTQELLAARRIDGGEQFFTRANDFGFSKSADEAFAIWGKSEILSDVMKVWNEYQPDIIITRFPPDERAGHGHHTASSVLAHEAYDLLSKDNTTTWRPKRVYVNTGRWWNKDINEKTPGVITMDIGGYNALLGKSYAEISALSSSQHKSQGWGAMGNRGYQPEFLELARGERADKDIFEGVNTTWSRLKGGEKIQPLIDKVIQSFDVENPSLIVPQLLNVRKEISQLENSVWRTRKLNDVTQLILDCLGLYVEVTADNFQGNPGDTISISAELINRCTEKVTLNAIKASGSDFDSTLNSILDPNIKKIIKSHHTLNPNLKYSEPYWLTAGHPAGIFTVEDKSLIGSPENKPAVNYNFKLSVGDETFEVTRPLVYKWVDPVKGELVRRFEIVPPVFINLSDKVLVFNNQDSKIISVVLKSSSDDVQRGNLTLDVPSGWRVMPASSSFEFNKSGQELLRTFTIYPSSQESIGTIEVKAEINGKQYNESLQYIDYDHFSIQTLLPPASIKVVRLDLKKEGNNIAYIKGAGDAIPLALRNMGYQVRELTNEEVTLDNLRKYDAVVLGIRAVNTNSRIRYFMTDLLQYVYGGGTVVMQYNTNSDLEADTFTPYPLKLSRDRVTQEDAEVRVLKPEHPVLNSPNKISDKDFSGWVQERGLYFPNQWDEHFEALLSMNDKGESPKNGSLLVAKHGNGYFIYTGISFFRQLPEAVPGAFKLFANLVSLKDQKVEDVQKKSKQKSK